jgi:hypothetical protein
MRCPKPDVALITKQGIERQGGFVVKRTPSSARLRMTFCTSLIVAAFALPGSNAIAQNPELQKHLQAIKQSAAMNKEALARYQWQEQQTVSIKGEVKKQELYQVQMGPNGKPQKTLVGPQDSSDSESGRRRGLKRKIVEKKKEEYKDYAEQIAELARSYAQPDPQRLQEAFQQGNVTLGSGGAPNQVRMVIRNYEKPGDSVTLDFDRARNVIHDMQIASYLASPSDAVTISAQYSQLPDGTNHVSKMQVNGVTKQLTVTMQNSNYQKI